MKCLVVNIEDHAETEADRDGLLLFSAVRGCCSPGQCYLATTTACETSTVTQPTAEDGYFEDPKHTRDGGGSA